MVAGGTDEFTLFSSWRKTKREVNILPFNWLKFKEKMTDKTLPLDADDFMSINYTNMERKVRIWMNKVFELLSAFCNMSNTVVFVHMGFFMWGLSSVQVFSFLSYHSHFNNLLVFRMVSVKDIICVVRIFYWLC